jgi:NAD(P)-dependent dehydrogenase (short-subunit alcohol dehydrogenase family)
VLITGREAAALKRSRKELAAAAGPGTTVLAETCDVRNEKAVVGIFAKVKKQWGRLDILVNNAGIPQPLREVVDTSTELWRAVIETNLTGTFLCTRESIPLMERGATIVNVLSLTVRSNPPKFAAYNASKLGVLGFTETLRTDLTPKGIRVTALLPGATDTAIWEQFWPDAPREHMVRAEDVAAGVVYAVCLPPQASVNDLLIVPQKGLL